MAHFHCRSFPPRFGYGALFAFPRFARLAGLVRALPCFSSRAVFCGVFRGGHGARRPSPPAWPHSGAAPFRAPGMVGGPWPACAPPMKRGLRRASLAAHHTN